MIMVTLRAAFQPENFINPNPSNHKMQLSDDEIVPIDDIQDQQQLGEEQTAVNTQQPESGSINNEHDPINGTIQEDDKQLTPRQSAKNL